MALILFYAVCLLYVISTATFGSDIVSLILYVSSYSICKNTIFLSVVVQTQVGTLSSQLQTDSEAMLFRISIIQTIVNGSCDFLAQCILVHITMIVLVFHFIDMNLQRSTVVGSFGVEISVS